MQCFGISIASVWARGWVKRMLIITTLSCLTNKVPGAKPYHLLLIHTAAPLSDRFSWRDEPGYSMPAKPRRKVTTSRSQTLADR
jgi:hypothetical protein